MADKEVGDLTAASALALADIVHIVQSGNSRKATGTQLRTLAGTFIGARVRRTSDQTTANYTSETAIPWQEAVVDTDSFWSAGAPARLTIPAAYNGRYANISGGVRIDATTADTFKNFSLRLRSSADVTQYGAVQSVEVGTTTVFAAASLVGVPLVTGDYIEATLREESDNSVTITAAIFSHLALQII